MNINQLNQQYALGLARLEIMQITGEIYDSGEEDKQLVNYFNSTPNRRGFGVQCVICGLEHEDCTPSQIAKCLGISSNSVDTMINECEAEGWIEVTRKSNNYRYVRAAQRLVDCYVCYAIKVADYGQEADFLGIQAARRYNKTNKATSLP